MSAALEVRELTVALREAPVELVQDVSLQVARGEVTAIVGETGAGKTVTMRALLGLLPPGLRPSGSVQLGDAPAVALDDRAGLARLRGRQVGIVLQNPFGAFDPLLRIGRQMAEGVVATGAAEPAAARDRAAELLGAMGFRDAQHVLDLYPHELSGGMRQRAAIAMAMMPEPGVIIADEPTSALDAHLRTGILELLRGLARDHDLAVVMISHDLSLVGRFCDTVTVMYAGRVVESGPAAETLARPAHHYTAALVAAAPRIDAEPRQPLPTIPGTLPSPEARPAGCAFVPRCPRADEVCSAERPLVGPVAPGRLTACHHPRVGEAGP
jgi:oligopeptide/dipeptide ABC transporter ATP-binding protein